jgi:PGM1 C-terminal domain
LTHPNALPGSAEERVAFAALQARLPALFRAVFADPAAPRTVVVVPGLSMDGEVLAKVVGGRHYEERQLAMLMLLRLPNTRIVYASSTRIEPAIVDYHLALLPGVAPRDARRRLVLLAAGDASAESLTRKILERPRLLERIRAAIGDPALAHLSCFNVTPDERTLAVRLGIPLYGCDPELMELGGKSGSRQAFREAGIALPDGREDLHDITDLVEALVELRRRNPALTRAVVKLNHGFSGEGNAVFTFAGCPDEGAARWIAAHLPLNLAIEARELGWDRYAGKLAEQGGIVEAWVTGEGVRSPSVQMRITPVGELEFISTHDQILGGPSGQIFQACTFPADPAYARDIQSLTWRVGEVLRARGVLGRFGVDFVSVPRDGGWEHHAIEINLRKGGTTHTYQMLQFLTGGRYDAERAGFVTPAGLARCYFATDNVTSPAYRRLTAEDLFEIAAQRGLRWDPLQQRGITFGLVGALPECGKLGMVAIDEDRDSARRRFRQAVAVLDEEAARE